VSGDPLRAAGAVLWRPADDGIEVALVHRPRYDDWSLPKGKVEAGEPDPTCAAREVAEETGFRGALGRSLGTTGYAVAVGPKTVRYWAMRADSGSFVGSAEVDGLAWCGVTEALARLTWPHDREPVRRLVARQWDTVTVLLVRHGSAGSRATWGGEDDERPLDEVGQAQAQRAAGTLAAFGPRCVESADLLRCRQTVAPLAEALHTDVRVHQMWSDDAVRIDPTRAVERVRELATSGVGAVVGSQGGAVPAIVEALAVTAGLPLRDARGRRRGGGRGVPSRKGSAWVLSLAPADGSLVDAEYLPRL